MSGADKRSGTTDLLAAYAEIDRLLRKSHEAVLQSTIRLSKAHDVLDQVARDGIGLRTELDECRRVLDLARS